MLILKNFSLAKELAKKYNIPLEDMILIVLNLYGVNADVSDKRIRFRFKLNGCKEIFYLALCVNTGKSPFFLKDNGLFFHKHRIGITTEEEKDTCDSTYFRKNKTAITLNSNSRSKCKGCKFCGTYSQDAEDSYNLLTKNRLTNHINNLLIKDNIKSLSHITDISICTGCFSCEKEAVEHILMVRNTLKNFGFKRELKYIGSQITSEKSLNVLKEYAKPFSLYFTLECFGRRKELLRHHKAKITVLKAKRVLRSARKKGFNTTILYILGLDPFEIVAREFKNILPCITRFPVINLFQNYLPDHKFLKTSQAENIEYYLKSRKEIEKIFAPTSLRPRLWENYRGLWYLSFRNKKINNIRI